MNDSVPYPADWQVTTLGALAEYINGYPFKPRDWDVLGLPIVRIAQMTDESAALDYYSGQSPREFLIDSGDLLFSWSASLVALIWQRGPAVLNQHIYKVLPKSGNNLRFLHHLLNSLVEPLANKSHGTTMRHVTRKDLLPFSVTVPFAPEQERVASVLDTMDAAISRTEHVIATLTQIRAGLLYDLLTRGLDENGRLRDPVTDPGQFQVSGSEQIPRAWKIETVASLLARGVIADVQDGNHGELHPKESDYVEQGIPFVMAADIAADRIAIENCKRIPLEMYNRLRIGHAFPGDVLLSHKASIGFVARLGIEHGTVMLTPQVTYYRVGREELLDGEFLEWLMRGPLFQSQLLSLAGQSTRDYVGITAQKNISITLPGRIEEQKAIVKHLSALQAVLDTNEAVLSKLRVIKSGFSTDLLTGRIRVPQALDPEEVCV